MSRLCVLGVRWREMKRFSVANMIVPQNVESDGPSVVTSRITSCSLGRFPFPDWHIQRLRGGCGRQRLLPTTPDTHATSWSWRIKSFQDHRLSARKANFDAEYCYASASNSRALMLAQAWICVSVLYTSVGLFARLRRLVRRVGA